MTFEEGEKSEGEVTAAGGGGRKEGVKAGILVLCTEELLVQVGWSAHLHVDATYYIIQN